MSGVSAVCCCAGTTAFPTLRWNGDNNPENNCYVGTKNLIELALEAPSDGEGESCGIHRFVFVSSAGVKRHSTPPYSIMNAFGVLTFKEMAEDAIKASGLPYTIIRPCRLTDAPYTSYDLNTLIKGKSGARKEVVLSMEENLDGETSRIATAEACVQCLMNGSMDGKSFSMESIDGEGPGSDDAEWMKRFDEMNNIT